MGFLKFAAPIFGAVILAGLVGWYAPSFYTYVKYVATAFVVFWCFRFLYRRH